MFKDKLNELMVEKNIYTQRQLSKLTGIPPTTISGWFNAGRLPDYTAIKKLSQFFEISSDELLEQSEFEDLKKYPVNSCSANFAKILKDLRQEAGLSQQKLAEYLGLSANTVCEWEKNRSEPSIQTIKKLAEFFDVSADYLLGLEDDFGAKTTTGGNVMRDTNTDEERELLELFRTLSPYLKGLTLDTVRGWAGGTGDKGLHKKA